jgi:hypothetical protein
VAAVFTPLPRYGGAVLSVVVLAPLLFTDCAQAQPTTRTSQLSALQQQNAVLQQRNAVQTAALQTTTLLQSAYQQNTGTSAINFQLQQSALQDALQLTSALRKSGTGGSTASGQMSILQNALQLSSALQTALQQQSGVLSVTQLQQLSQVQTSLQGLLLSRPQPLPNRKPGP